LASGYDGIALLPRGLINLVNFPFHFFPFSDTRTFQAAQALHPYLRVDRRSRGMDWFTENRKWDGLVGQACDICAWGWASHDACVSDTAEILKDVANRIQRGSGRPTPSPHSSTAILHSLLLRRHRSKFHQL